MTVYANSIALIFGYLTNQGIGLGRLLWQWGITQTSACPNNMQCKAILLVICKIYGTMTTTTNITTFSFYLTNLLFCILLQVRLGFQNGPDLTWHNLQGLLQKGCFRYEMPILLPYQQCQCNWRGLWNTQAVVEAMKAIWHYKLIIFQLQLHGRVIILNSLVYTQQTTWAHVSLCDKVFAKNQL